MNLIATLTKTLLYVFLVFISISCNNKNPQSQASSADTTSKAVADVSNAADTTATVTDTSTINSYAKDVLKKGQSSFLQNIKEDITNNNFAGATKKFKYVNDNFPPGGVTGTSVYPEEEQRLYDEIKIDLKVYKIMSASHEPSPSSQLLSTDSGTTTHLKVINQTPYPLSVDFSGLHSFEVNVAPGESQVVALKAGQYNSSASLISTFDVAHFAGPQNYKAGNYQVTYYVKDI